MPFGTATTPYENVAPAERDVGLNDTPITAPELYVALAQAWPEVAGGKAPRKAMLLLLAQSALETGHWKHGIYNYNLANLKHFAGDGYDFHTMRVPEYVNGHRVTVTAKFRAYPSLKAAAADYLSLLERKYKFAWPELLRGDARGFAHKLRLGRFYTEPEASYASKLGSVYRRYDRSIVEEADGRIVLMNYADDEEDVPLLEEYTPAGTIALGVGLLTGGFWLFTRKVTS